MPTNLLEPELAEPYNAWRASPGPEGNAAFLKALHPVIEGAVRTHVGTPNPLILSRARRMALEGAQTYDPARGRLKTHLYNQLQGLRRVQRQQTQILRVPERVALERQRFDELDRELEHELGRSPSDAELSDRFGVAQRRLARIRAYTPAVAEGTLESASPTGEVLGGAKGPAAGRHNTWAQLVYADLDAYHQKVMEWTLGMNGRKPLPNQEIARRLNRSPGAVSQAKLRIQQLLDQEDALSPF